MQPLSWLKNYNRENLIPDILSGLIVAVMLVPQAMAYALLAGLPPVVGLYSATIPLLIYAIFGSSRHLAVGPVAIVSLLTLSGISQIAEAGTENYIALAALLALMVGLIQFVLGLLRAGFITDFLSHAVISGFTSAAAIIIGISQLKHLFGVNVPRGHSVFETGIELVRNVQDTNLYSLAIGVIGIILLVVLKRLSKSFPAPLVVVVLSVVAVYFFKLEDFAVQIVGAVPQGFPTLSLPNIDFNSIQALMPIALAIAFVSFMESIAVAQSIASKEKYKLDANAELIGLGLANIVGSIFKGYPVTGGFSRTAVNYQSGAKTPLAAIVTALLVIITLLFLTPLFYYLPKAVLAAIILVAVYGLIDIKTARHLFRLKAVDGWTLVLTFIATLVLGVELGILAGVLFSLAVFIRRSAYPHTAELGYLASEDVYRNVNRYPEAKVQEGVLITRVDASLYFANMAYLEKRLNQAVVDRPNLHTIILDFSAVNDMDAVAIEVLEERMNAFAAQGIVILISGMKGPVRDLVSQTGWTEQFGEKISFNSIKQAVSSLA